MRLFIVCCCAIGLFGCSPVNQEELVQEVLKADPSFSQVLDKRQEVSSRLETFERELALKKKSVERRIRQLRDDLATTVKNVRKKVEHSKKLMDPNRERLQLSLSMASEELRAKRTQRASVGRFADKLRKSLKSKSSSLSAADRSRQEAQLAEMVRDSKRLDQELVTIKNHVRLIKLKLILIKL